MHCQHVFLCKNYKLMLISVYGAVFAAFMCMSGNLKEKYWNRLQ